MKLTKEQIFRFAFFALLTIGYVVLVGYQFGTGDQNIHIPFVKQFANPSLYPNDPFLNLKDVHFSYFWKIISTLLQFFQLEPLLLLLHCLSIFLAFWAIFDLSYFLTKDKRVAYCSALVFLIPKIAFSLFPAMEFSILNRTFVFPFLLWAILDFLKGNRIRAFAWFGMLYNLHVISVHSAIFMCLPVLFFSSSPKKRIGNILLALGTFVVFALPTFIWVLSSPVHEPFIDREWFSLIFRGVLANLFNPIIPFPLMLAPTLSGVGCVLLFLATYRAQNRQQREVSIMFYAAIVGLLGAYIFYVVFPFTLLVQMQFTRITKFLPIFVIPIALKYAWNHFDRKVFTRSQLICWIASILLTPVFLMTPLLMWCIRRKKLILSFSLIIINLVVCMLILYSVKIWVPGGSIQTENNDWHKMQLWVKDNTPLDSNFLVPVEKWWFDIADFRTFSERPTFVLLGDLLEGAFSPNYTKEWTKRFSELLPDITLQFHGNILENKKLLHDAYLQIPEDRIKNIASKYSLDFVVMENTRMLSFPVIYENETYRVYAIE